MSYTAMIKFLNKFFQTNNSNLSAQEYYELGNEKEMLGDYKGAIGFYSKAIHVNPKVEKFYFFKSRTEYKLLNYRAALNDIHEAIKLNPTSSINYILSGEIRITIKQYKEAVNDSEVALKFNSLSGNASSILGQAEICLNNYNKGIVAITNAIENGPDKLFLTLMSVSGREDDIKNPIVGSLNKLKYMQRISDFLFENLFYRGLAYYHLNDYENALKDLTRIKEGSGAEMAKELINKIRGSGKL